MRRYAFIDVQNTDRTARDVCGFKIDWIRLFTYLRAEWSCTVVCFYVSLPHDDERLAATFQALSELRGCVVGKKATKRYPRLSSMLSTPCMNCNQVTLVSVPPGTRSKGNCDVDLTIGMMRVLTRDPTAEIMLFSGDGDFAPLLALASRTSNQVYICSSAHSKTKNGMRYAPLSSTLRRMSDLAEGNMKFIELGELRADLER